MDNWRTFRNYTFTGDMIRENSSVEENIKCIKNHRNSYKT